MKRQRPQKKQHQQAGRSEPKRDEMPTVFVGGIPLDVCFEDVMQYLQRFGEVENLELVRDKRTQTLKGFAKCKMQTRSGTDNLLSASEHILNGLVLGVKLWTPKSEYVQCKDEVFKRKLFVKHSTNLTKNDLFEHFSRFGRIQEVDYKTDHKSKQPRGFSYIVFYSDLHALQAVEGSRLAEESRFIECEVTKPSHVLRESLRTNGNKKQHSIRNEDDLLKHQPQQLTHQTLSGGKRSVGRIETSTSLVVGNEASSEWLTFDANLKRKESLATCLDSLYQGQRTNPTSPKLLNLPQCDLSEVDKLLKQEIDEEDFHHTAKPTLKAYYISVSYRTDNFLTTYRYNQHCRHHSIRIN